MEKLKARAENYSIDELKSMKSINSRLYFQLQDYIINNRGHPLFLIGGRGFGKTFNVLMVITSPKCVGRITTVRSTNIDNELINENKKNERKRKKKLKLLVKSPTVFIFKKNEKQEIWKPIEGEYIKSSNLSEIFNTSSILVFDDIHYICERVLKNEISVDFLVDLFKNILEATKLEIPTIIISDEMLSWYAGQMENDELDDLILMFGEVSFRKMQELSKIELKKYQDRRNFLAKLELPPITYEEFDLLFEFSHIEADDFVKDFLYKNANGNPRGFAKFVSVFHSEKITVDMLVQIARERLLKCDGGKRYLHMMGFPTLPVLIDNDIVDKARKKFNTFEKFHAFVNTKNELEEKIYKKIDLNYEKICDLLTEQNIYPPFHLKRDENYVRNYKKLMSIIWKKSIDIYKQIPEIPELTKWKTIYGKYIRTYDSLEKLKIKTKMDDIDFEWFWKSISGNYDKNRLAKPFQVAFRKELNEGWYLDKKRFKI